MNILNLLEIIKNQVDYTTAKKIINDFMDNFTTEYKKARYTKGTAKKAIENYKIAANYKDEKTPGVYANPATVLIINDNNNITGPKTELKKDLSKIALEWMKNRRPVECHFIESIVLYKLLKKQEEQQYFLKIDNRYYNPALIAEMLQCIVTEKNKYIRAEICENGALLIQQENAAALILPYIWENVDFTKNVNITDFLHYTDEIENNLLKEELKTA